MRIFIRYVVVTVVLGGVLFTPIASAAAFGSLNAFAQTTPQTVLAALIKAVAAAPQFPKLRSSGVGGGSETPLTEADAKKAVSGVASVVIDSMRALAGGFGFVAHEFSEVSRELATAEVAVPARHAQDVFVSGVSRVSYLLLGMPARTTLNAIRAGTGAGSTLRPSASNERSGNAVASFAIASAYAAEPQDAEWNELAAETDKLKRQFNTEVTLPFFQPPVKRLDMYPYARNTRNAFAAAADAATARNGESAVRALEAAVGALTGFMERFPDDRGGALYAGFEDVLPRALHALVLARMLESGGTSPPREEILSDPKALVYRAEQIGPEETARKSAELRKKLQDVEAQLAKNPDPKLLLLAKELRGAIKNLDRIMKAIPFVMQQIKMPTLSCSPLNTDAVLRKVKEFAVATEANPLLEGFRKKLIADAMKKLRDEEAARKKKNEPGRPLPAKDEDFIARTMDKDKSQTFQPEDDPSWFNYKPDNNHWYRPLPGRLRYGSGEYPNQAAGGIFRHAYGGLGVRKQEVLMVGMYMAEDAFARFAADCTKPPSTVIQEVMDRLARYIDATSAFSEEGALAMVREELEKVVAEYRGGLSAVLGVLDNEVYGNVRSIIGNLDTVNRSWTAVSPDVTKLFAEVRAALLALKALGLETTAWIDDLEAAITKQPGKEKIPTAKDLTINCPTKSKPGKGCAAGEPLPPPPTTFNSCALFGDPGYPESAGSVFLGPKPAYTCANGNVVYAGVCCKSNAECAHPSPDRVWGTNGQPSSGLDNYTNVLGTARVNSDGTVTEAALVARCHMDLATSPNIPFEDRPGCRNFPTPERFEADVCGVTLSAAPTDTGSAPSACLTGSAAEQEKLLSLLSKCVTREEKDRVSLAFVWEQAKQFLRAWFLELLQGEMDKLPKEVTLDTQKILLGFVDSFTANALRSPLARGYNAGNSVFVARVVKYDRMLRAAIKRIQFTGATFAPMWRVVSGPKVIAVRMITDPYGGIPQHVFTAVSAEVRSVLEPVFAEIEADSKGTLSLSTELAFGDSIVAGAAAARAATILNFAKDFSAYWENEKSLSSKTSLNEILLSVLEETNDDAKLGGFLPLVLPSLAARYNLLGMFDLHAFLDSITDPEQSSLPLKKFFAVASAIDRVVDALKKLAEKDVELSESVTACVAGIDSGKAIGAALKKINDALPEEKDIKDPYERDVVRNLRNLQQGLQSLGQSAEGKKGDTPFDVALDEVRRNIADRLAREAAAALRREQGVIRR